ncbi:MAG: peptidoglycan DD-metalloendopeptidase family protein [Thermoanaerobaculum sp.]|nr:peptidoglycan DD-metalloendopeptidase family protein [Thermoanaerobaculum sp.]
MLFCKALALLAAVTVEAPAPVVVQGDPAAWEELSQRAALLSQRLKELTAQAAALADRRAQLENQLAVAALRVQEGEVELALIQREVHQEQQRLQALQEELARQQRKVKVAAGVLAVLRRVTGPYLASLLWWDPQQFTQRFTVLLAVLEYHRRNLIRLQELLQRQREGVAWLSRKEAGWRQKLGELERRRRELMVTRQKVLAELASVEAVRRQQAMALSDLREAQERLERLWGRLVSGEERFAPGVRLLKGGLPWPAEGARVVRGFGRLRDPRYATVVLHPGWDLQVAEGAEVKAVAAGKVVYAQFFKSLGNLVIVAHGEDLYTLYGRLATMFVRGGQRVGSGEPLGLAGSQGAEGNLYFEVRNGTVAQDPGLWLRPQG